MPRPKNTVVQDFIQAGMGRRQAFQLAKVMDGPIALQRVQQHRLSLADAAKMAKDWPDYRGEQALLSFHVLNGWKLRDAEAAYSAAVQDAIGELEAVNPGMSNTDALRIVDERVTGPVRDMVQLPRKVQSCTIQPVPSDPLAEAVAEIRRLRVMLQDVGVNPDG